MLFKFWLIFICSVYISWLSEQCLLCAVMIQMLEKCLGLFEEILCHNDFSDFRLKSTWKAATPETVPWQNVMQIVIGFSGCMWCQWFKCVFW